MVINHRHTITSANLRRSAISPQHLQKGGLEVNKFCDLRTSKFEYNLYLQFLPTRVASRWIAFIGSDALVRISGMAPSFELQGEVEGNEPARDGASSMFAVSFAYLVRHKASPSKQYSSITRQSAIIKGGEMRPLPRLRRQPGCRNIRHRGGNDPAPTGLRCKPSGRIREFRS